MNGWRALLTLLLASTLAACAGKGAVRTPEEVPAAPVAVDPEKPVAVEDNTLVKVDVGNSVFFEAGQSDLSGSEKARLQEHAQRLKANPRLHVTLVGHTDHSGSPSLNIAVAERRARSVYAQLRAFGVPAGQLRRYSVGGEKGRLHCQSAECRQQQRRVDLVYRQSRH